MKSLEKKKILLGVCGGIAAYKSVELLRLFVKEGADVRVVMTKNAEKFVTPLTFQALSGKPVLSDTFKLDETGITHIETAREADIFVVAPATANIIGKFAGGIADDLFSTLFLAISSPVLIAPAMNHNMYIHPLVQQNIKILNEIGTRFIGPEKGELACKDEGIGRLSDPESILSAVRCLKKSRQDLKKVKILVTAGPTREYLDPVRYISNPSSGKMGYAIAAAAYWRGAEVTLISGPVNLKPPAGIKLLKVNTTEQMRDAVLKEAEQTEVTIMAAAVGDFLSDVVRKEKIKKEEGEIVIKLRKNRDILLEMKEKGVGGLRIGFAAETENVIKNAKRKIVEKELDLIVANDVSDPEIGFGSDFNKVVFIDKKGTVNESSKMSKYEIADLLIDWVVSVW